MHIDTDILIVEDSPTQAAELQYLLETAGCQVRLAHNGVAALTAVAERRPMMVISDIVMPEMDGYELCRRLKGEEATRSIPVILVTALSNARDVIHGLACGADNFIVKPYEQQYLISRIRYFLVNMELRAHERVQMGVEVVLEGERHFITAGRQQILDLLISTYEQGMRLNHELQVKHDELSKSNSLLSSLFQFTSSLTDVKSEQQVIEAALKRLLEFPDALGAWLLMEASAAGAAQVVGAKGRGDDYSLEHLQTCASDCPCRYALGRDRLSAPINIAGCPALTSQGGEQVHASIPLVLGTDTIGLLNVVRADAQAWSADNLNALASIGRQLAMAVGRARLFDGLEQLVAQRTQALSQSEALLRMTLDNLPVGVMVADQQGRLVIGNPESRLIWNGALPVAGETLAWRAESGEPIAPQDWPLQRAVRLGEVARNTVIDIQTRDGERKTLLNSAVPFRDQQNLIQGAIVVLQDISEQRRRDLETRTLTRAVEASVNAVVISDNELPDRPIVYVNPAFERITGYRAEEVLGRNCRLLQGEHHDQVELEAVRRSLSALEEGGALLRNYRKDGSEFWNDLKLSPVVNDRGKVSHFVGIIHDITESKRYQDELEHQANHDSLTGLPNRNLLNDRIRQAIAYASRDHGQFTLAFMDLDNFKVVNDGLGHTAGDQLLSRVAAHLQAGVSEIDTVARLGGDEFIILLVGNETLSEQMGRLERLKLAITAPMLLDGQEVAVSCSIGFCCFPSDGQDADTLLRNADTAMYQAKHQGRNRICAFMPQMNEQVQKRLSLERDIRQALQSQEYSVVYQPQLDLRSGRLCGFEALVRWKRQGQMVQPNDFIPLAEETGWIVAIDFYVLDAVCRQLLIWHQTYGQDLSVAVNFSAISLMSDDVVERVIATLDRHGVAPRWLKIELTETSLMTNAENALSKMLALSELGIGFSIDDFGTGYSSLGYLKRFPFSQLKIDRSFINDVITEPDSASLTRSMISIGHNLGIKVIAEGVENAEQLGFLRAAGCDELQGYYYSPPLPPQACVQFLQKDSVLMLPDNITLSHERYLLIITDDPQVLEALERELHLENYKILTVGNRQAALELLATRPIDVVLSDTQVGEKDGVALLRRIQGISPDVIRLVLSVPGELGNLLKALNEGIIYRFIATPWEPDNLRTQLRDAFRQRELYRENERMRGLLRL